MIEKRKKSKPEQQLSYRRMVAKYVLLIIYLGWLKILIEELLGQRVAFIEWSGNFVTYKIIYTLTITYALLFAIFAVLYVWAYGKRLHIGIVTLAYLPALASIASWSYVAFGDTQTLVEDLFIYGAFAAFNFFLPYIASLVIHFQRQRH